LFSVRRRKSQNHTAQSTAKATGPHQGARPMMMILLLALLAEVSERACERPNLEDSEGGSVAIDCSSGRAVDRAGRWGAPIFDSAAPLCLTAISVSPPSLCGGAVKSGRCEKYLQARFPVLHEPLPALRAQHAAGQCTGRGGARVGRAGAAPSTAQPQRLLSPPQ
jgi:hypothetical protein